MDQFHGNRRRARDCEAQVRKVVIGKLRVRENRLIDRRRTRQHADTILGNAAQYLIHIEDQMRKDRCAPHDGRQPARLVSEGVEERIHDQIAIA